MSHKFTIERSNQFAYVSDGFGLVVINKNKKGFRCSDEACKNLSKSKAGLDVYSVKIDDEILWVSDNEFKRYNLVEYSIPKNEFKGK